MKYVQPLLLKDAKKKAGKGRPKNPQLTEAEKEARRLATNEKARLKRLKEKAEKDAQPKTENVIQKKSKKKN